MRFTDEKGDQLLFDEPGQSYIPKPGSGTGVRSSQSDQYYSTDEIMNPVRELFGGPPDLDPMSCDEANQHVQAKHYYTAENDGLVQPWFGNVYWNPPWSGTGSDSMKNRGVTKLLTGYRSGEVKQAICVLNGNATTTRWFQPLLDWYVCFPPKRIRFYIASGLGESPSTGTVIVYVGSDVNRFIGAFGHLGKVLHPCADSCRPLSETDSFDDPLFPVERWDA
jgi:hypothetical protein